MKRRLALLVTVACLWAGPALAATEVVCINFASGTGSPATGTWTPFADWNNANNKIEVLGAGGDGGAATTGGFGGGGSGGYTVSTNVTLTPSGSANFQIGVHGGSQTSTAATWICNGTTSCTNPTAANVVASARGGTTATAAAGGAGGLATGVVGTTPTAGASGGAGSSTHGGGGGGAPPGPAGAGGAGVAGTTSGGGAGGVGDNATGGAGGVGGLIGSAATAGSAGSEIDASCTLMQGGTTVVGAGGGGGGGALSTNLDGKAAGAFSAGGGGSGPLGAAGAGFNGIIRITNTPAAVTGARRGLLMGVGP